MSNDPVIETLRALVNDKRITSAGWSVLRPVIDRAARRYGKRDDLHDVTQEVVLKLLKTTHGFEGDSNGAAVTYLKRTTHGVIVDRARRADARIKTSDPPSVDDPYAHIVVAHDDDEVTWDEQARLLEDLLDRLRGEVDARVAHSGKPVLQRELASKQAEATLLARVSALESKQVALELGVPNAKSDAIAKWVERGRPWVLAAIDALAEGASPDEAKVLSNLRELVARRRKDAGVTRSSSKLTTTKTKKTNKPSKGPRR